MCYGPSISTKVTRAAADTVDPQRRRSALPQARTPRALAEGAMRPIPNNSSPAVCSLLENALLHVSRNAGHRFADDDVDVVARIVLGRLES